MVRPIGLEPKTSGSGDRARTRGGQLDAERFAKVPANYRPGKFGAAVYRLASPKPDNPVFLFESYNGGGSEFGCHGGHAPALPRASVTDRAVNGLSDEEFPGRGVRSGTA